MWKQFFGGLSVGSWLRVREEAASTTKPHDTVRTEDPAAGRGPPVKGSGDTCQSDNCHFHPGQGRGKVLLSNGETGSVTASSMDESLKSSHFSS